MSKRFEIVSTRLETRQFGAAVLNLKDSRDRLWLFLRRNPLLEGIYLFVRGRNATLIAVNNADRSTPILLLLMRLFRSARKIVLLDLMRAQPSSPWKQRVWPHYNRLFLAPTMRRTVIGAHVLSEPERERYSRLYGLPIERLYYIPFPLFRPDVPPLPDVLQIGGVVASGRALCDWELVFAAAEGRTWPLTVICSETDVERVDALNRAGRATRYTELTHVEHDQLVAGADVYVLAVREEATSAGHVRLRAAIENGTPVVATAISGLTGYLEAGVTLSVPPGDVSALRAAIEELLGRPEERERMAAAARAWASSERSFDHYLASMREMFETLLAEARSSLGR
jgi:hypothetical protein